MPDRAPRPSRAPASPPPVPLPDYGWTGRRLGRAVLGLMLAVVGTITLVPFAFRWPERLRVVVWNNPFHLMAFDVVANVALFVPLGFLYALTRAADPRPAAPRAPLVRALLLGGAASVLVETAQLFEPERYASPLDVATNALGALLGAWAHRRVAARLGADTRLVGRLALELPLMGLVYLLAPLCTLAALTLGGAPAAPDGTAAARPFGLVALALFGGTLLGQVQHRHFGPAGALSAPAMGAAAGGWFALAAVPALVTGRLALAVGVAAAAAAAWAYGRVPLEPSQANRRFEVTALSRAAPYLAAYVALLALGDPSPPGGGGLLSKLDVLRRLEALVAFVALGYVLAEAWGRLELRYRHTAGRVALAAGVGSVLAEALRHGGLPPLDVAPAVAARVVAAAYGGWVYHLQRAHVRALVAARHVRSTANEQRRAA